MTSNTKRRYSRPARPFTCRLHGHSQATPGTERARLRALPAPLQLLRAVLRMLLPEKACRPVLCMASAWGAKAAATPRASRVCTAGTWALRGQNGCRYLPRTWLPPPTQAPATHAGLEHNCSQRLRLFASPPDPTPREPPGLREVVPVVPVDRAGEARWRDEPRRRRPRLTCARGRPARPRA